MVPPVSPRKALAMTISQQTTSLSDQAREADGVLEVSCDIHAEAMRISISSVSLSLLISVFIAVISISTSSLKKRTSLLKNETAEF